MKTPLDIQTLVDSTLVDLSPVTARLMQATKGSFQSVTWKSNPKPAAIHKGITLEKQTTAVCKAGIDFANLSSVKAGIASGERGEVESLPWGEWEAFPFTIAHKGERYVRLYPAAQSNQARTHYFADGKEIGGLEFMSYLTPSDAAKMASHDKPACFTVRESNLIG